MESRSSLDPAATLETTITLAEDLPELYRAILDRVAELERIGARHDAGQIRLSATRVYSDAWDERARRRLLALLARANRALAAPDRTRGWTFRRRSAPAR